MYTRLILVRHGETGANREQRYIGRYHAALTEAGQAQARQLAEALARLPAAAVYSSPSERAYHTAQPIAFRHRLELRVEDALRECDFGSWEGLNRAEIVAKSPYEAQLFQAWQQDTSITPPGGESTSAMHRRVCAAIDCLGQTHLDQTIVLVSHTGPIKALLCAALAAPVSLLFRLSIDLASVSIIDWHPSLPRVRLINGCASWGLHPEMFIGV
jgi:ribonuclease H / adenosylcobalamin/alpha-ribazole phosphatase